MTKGFTLSRRSLLAGTAATAFGATFGLPLRALAQQNGGTLRIQTLGLDTADPHRHTGSIGVQQIYAEALTSIGTNGAVEPFLAESFDISDDGRVHTFHLRPDVRFHNGDVLTAADVVANITRVRDNVTGGWLASAMQLVDDVQAADDATVVLTMQEPYAPLLALMSELWILSPKSDGWNDTITLPIGTGPFQFGEWLPNVTLTSPRNEEYWLAGHPLVDAVQFDLRDAPSASRALALRAGDLHIASLEFADAQQLRQSDEVDILPMKDTSWYSVSFNNRAPRPPFDDVRVRQAVAYALDKAAFMNFVAGDTGIVTNQLVAPGNIYFDQALHDADLHMTPDLERARALLAEAGVDPAATTVEFVSWQDAYAQVAVQMVRALGFNVNHVALDDLGAQNRLGQYDWDINCMSSGARADVFLRYVRLMSDGPNPVLWGGQQDAEFDALVNQAVAEPALEPRKALYLAAWQRVMDQYNVIVLGHGFGNVGVSRLVSGYDTGFTQAPNWAGGGVAYASLQGGA
jgi:ABC-type transport system substrate-binding protein